MRVTDRMLFDLTLRNGGAARARLEEASAQASSGKRVVHPGDDPAAAGLVVQSRAQQKLLDSLATGTQRASDELATVDQSLDRVQGSVARAREMAVTYANASWNATDRAAAAQEVQGLLDDAVAALNAKVGDRYVMGGYQDATAPFSAAGVYQGDAGVRQVEIAPGVYQASSVRADVAVSGVGGGVNVLASLQALRTALTTNDVPGIQAAIGTLTTGTAQLAVARTQVGTSMSALDAATTANQAARDAAKAAVGKLADADAIDANTQLALAEQALNASLTATASTFNLTLLNKIS